VTDWEGMKVVDSEMDRCTRWIKETTWIRKTVSTMNRDEGEPQIESHVEQSAIHAIW